MKKRILQVINSMDVGGAETLLMNIFRKVNKEMQFIFFVSVFDKCYYEDEIIHLGGEMIHSVCKSKNLGRYTRELFKVLKTDIDIVHIHTSNAMAVIPTYIAIAAGIKKVVIHSHSSNNDVNIYVNEFAKKILACTNGIERVACSDKAGKWLFGESPFTLLVNGVDCFKFKYNEEIRKRLRKSYQLNESKVYVHIGRFEVEKNHKFLIDVYNEIYTKEKNSVLLLLGRGKELRTIKNYVNTLDCQNHIKFLGIRNDTEEILQIADCFIFPSIFEGLPLTVVEAQARGIPCFISRNITTMVDANSYVIRMDINKTPAYWANEILNWHPVKINIEQEYEKVKEKFDIEIVVKGLMDIYGVKYKNE